mmetsp:Transcript_29075/g.60780  ORF Transcript_29075/g.60780 Transcript_29075/m.60780 type:complete len:129 (-) Transcript_29075:83-469(-)
MGLFHPREACLERVSKKYGPVVLEVADQVGRVKRIDRQGHPFQKHWSQNGYDTAWVPRGCGMVRSGREEDCVLDPERLMVLGRAHVQAVGTACLPGKCRVESRQTRVQVERQARAESCVVVFGGLTSS